MTYYIIGSIISLVVIGYFIGKKILVVLRDKKMQEETQKKDVLDKKEADKVAEEKEEVSSPSLDENPTNQTKNIPQMVLALKKADTHFSRENWEEAEKEYIKVLAFQEDHPEAMNKLGLIYLKQEQFLKAEIILKKLIELMPKNPIYFSNLGVSLYKQGKLSEAIVSYEKSLNLDDSRPARFVSLGQIYYELENLEKALFYFEEALKRDLKNIELCFQIIEIAKTSALIEKELHYLNHIMQIDPYNEIAKSRLEKLKS